ncbi:MAG: PilW family protein [Cycloclasticus sp.]
MNSLKNQRGLTLVEMLIAVVLGLFVTAVIISVFSTNVRSSTENLQMIRLNQELRGAMTLMADELKRAGYSADPTNADFVDDFNVSASCIRYSYDEDEDGIRDSDERFGFTLDNNRVRWTNRGGTVGAKGSAVCSTSTSAWYSITTADIALITTLDFSLDNSVNTLNVSSLTALTTNSGVSVYDVTITLTGIKDLPHNSAANDPRRTIEETVRVRNDDPKD